MCVGYLLVELDKIEGLALDAVLLTVDINEHARERSQFCSWEADVVLPRRIIFQVKP
jgi:hypothetical protein